MQIKSQHISIHFSKLLISFVLDILYFPIWWYSLGLVRLIRGLIYFLINQQKALAITVWIKNIFVPMYGMRDIGSFFISLFMRIFQIIVRCIALLILALIAISIVAIWIVVPVAIEYAIYLQFF